MSPLENSLSSEADLRDILTGLQEGNNHCGPVLKSRTKTRWNREIPQSAVYVAVISQINVICPTNTLSR